MNVYDQLRQLQVMPHSFKEWATYRALLTDYLIKQIPSHHQVAIIGAGACNDLDLIKLSEHVKTLTLIDRDEQAMQGALDKYGMVKQANCYVKVCDLLGIQDEAYRLYADTLVAEVRKKGLYTDMQVLLEVAFAAVDKLVQPCVQSSLDWLFEPYDTIVAIGIHSQLLAMVDWIWQAVLQALGQQDNLIRAKIQLLNQDMVARFNTMLFKSTRDQCIMGYEINRIGRLGRIEGAFQCEQDLAKRLADRKITQTSRCILEWPFDTTKGVVYQMAIESYGV